jgi:hypothetical protein
MLWLEWILKWRQGMVVLHGIANMHGGLQVCQLSVWHGWLLQGRHTL